jgi:hypothetical protein
MAEPTLNPGILISDRPEDKPIETPVKPSASDVLAGVLNDPKALNTIDVARNMVSK